MLRVEFQNDALDLSIEALLPRAAGPPLEASLVPDRLIVQNWSELRLEPVPKVNCGRHNDGVAALDELKCSSSTSVRLHVEGMRELGIISLIPTPAASLADGLTRYRTIVNAHVQSGNETVPFAWTLIRLLATLLAEQLMGLT
jgi:hypothetical protein